MGQDKALLRLGEESLSECLIRHMQQCFESTILSVRESKTSIPFSQLCDLGGSHGPMIGVATAMKTVSTPWLFVIGCDMPFVSLSLIAAMAECRNGQHIVAPKVHGVVQPLFAFYAKSCLPVLESHIQQGQRSLKKVMAELDAEIFNEALCKRHDPALLSFFDLDTIDDLARARRLSECLGGSIRSLT